MLTKLILASLSLAMFKTAFAGAASFCANPVMFTGGNTNCTSTCAAIAASGNFALANGVYGTCMGRATTRLVQVQAIDWGREEIGNESRCQIWTGDDMELDTVSGIGFTSKYPISLSACTPGTTYDTFYVTISRYEQIAGEAPFPDGSGKIVRTTNLYAAKDLAHAADPVNLGNWRDIASADNTKPYGIPNALSPGWINKKLSATPSNTDLTASSNALMWWDGLKASYSSNTNTVARPGYSCFQNPDGTGLDTSDCTQDNGDGTYTVILPTRPHTLLPTDEKLDLSYVKLKVDQGNNQFNGIEFLWTMDGGVLKYVGFMQAEAQGNYDELTYSNVGPIDID